MERKTSIWVLYIAEQGGYDAGFSLHMSRAEGVAALLDYAKATSGEAEVEGPTVDAASTDADLNEAIAWYEDHCSDPYCLDNAALPEAIERRLRLVPCATCGVEHRVDQSCEPLNAAEEAEAAKLRALSAGDLAAAMRQPRPFVAGVNMARVWLRVQAERGAL